MLHPHVPISSLGALRCSPQNFSSFACRYIHYDGRNRLSNFWTPAQSKKDASLLKEDGHDLLIRAGYMRQAHAGVFHLLPLGLRVQDKIERLIDKHMLSLGASKVALSSMTSEELWQRSGRLDKGRGNEFFKLEDRKGGKLLLSPTHEEEITTIVANAVHSHKQLPLRLYQVSRKYRDEARPRQGLLRGREFVMKDLYTFDATHEAALKTYEIVRSAYRAFLDELHLPYLVADADPGNMGGNLSHEYHFASASGEDTIIQCDSCGYSINEELFIGRPDASGVELHGAEQMTQSYMISKDRKTLLCVLYPAGSELNSQAIKAVAPNTDFSVENSRQVFADGIKGVTTERIFSVLCDPRTEHAAERVLATGDLQRQASSLGATFALNLLEAKIHRQKILLTKARTGDRCHHCSEGKLHLHKAVEIGHTFHLGTRYSEPLDLRITDATNKQALVHMGCHGIGVSRLIGAAAALLSDEKGLNWPFAIAPFGTLLVRAGKTSAEDVDALYDMLCSEGMDAVIDDRADLPLGWKLNDADLIGYPFIVVVGKAWSERKAAELQCRRHGVKEQVVASELLARLATLSRQL
ncbi:hypothetical protein LTR78_007819 [Recurvomyces mirabilis]|uniref:proline--tRNA ligase n=1 Tax=Recurvomyces mirabilis TaxID=574656 RepID=A0AAE0TV72_9PEZI|nr:hypothetical protein LTR78_007819 [Recurvomyces mirabilis]KAK5160139.1 hypothetical protein LTS14_002246 [Recurvomyces mirabilis]